MRRLTLILALLGFALPIPAQRLPRTVIPVHYDLSFEPDFQTDRFQGVETIDVSIQQATREIVLHAVEIDFQERGSVRLSPMRSLTCGSATW